MDAAAMVELYMGRFCSSIFGDVWHIAYNCYDVNINRILSMPIGSALSRNET